MDIRSTLLEVIEAQSPKSRTDASLQTNTVLREVSRRLSARNNHEIEEAILTQWHELFRTVRIPLNVATHSGVKAAT